MTMQHNNFTFNFVPHEGKVVARCNHCDWQSMLHEAVVAQAGRQIGYTETLAQEVEWHSKYSSAPTLELTAKAA